MAGNAILTLNGTVTFTDNKLNGYEGGDAKGGAIYVFNAILTLNGTVSFTNNEANTSFEVGGTGGAVYLYNSLNPFIYCTEVEKCATNECFFQLPGQNLSNGLDVQFVFKNDSADDAGSYMVVQ